MSNKMNNQLNDKRMAPQRPAPSTASPTAETIVPDIPNCWDCSSQQYRDNEREICYTEPNITLDSCSQRGGIHVSWLHYCTLGLLICGMGMVLTLWTAIALNRSNPMTFSYATPWTLQPVSPIRPDTDGGVHVDVANARTVHVTKTIEVFQTVMVEAISTPTFISTTTVEDLDSTSGSSTSNLVVLPSTTSITNIPAQSTTTSVTTETSISTLNTSMKRVRSTTRYFK